MRTVTKEELFMPASEWLIRYEELGRFSEYTDEELKVYGAFIKQCAEIFNRGKT